MKMLDLRVYMKSIEDKLGETRAADGIREDLPCNEEKWFQVVIKELDKCSRQYAHNLGQGMKIVWNKGIYKLGLEEAPPTRLLSLAIVTSAWLGWIFQEKEGGRPDSPLHPDRCWEIVKSAFEYGRNLSYKHERP